MIRWKFVIGFYVVIIIFVKMVVSCVGEDINCKKAGGKPTRIGCVKKDIFVE